MINGESRIEASRKSVRAVIGRPLGPQAVKPCKGMYYTASVSSPSVGSSIWIIWYERYAPSTRCTAWDDNCCGNAKASFLDSGYIQLEAQCCTVCIRVQNLSQNELCGRAVESGRDEGGIKRLVHLVHSELGSKVQGYSDQTVSLNSDQWLPPPKTSVMMKAVDVAQR